MRVSAFITAAAVAVSSVTAASCPRNSTITRSQSTHTRTRPAGTPASSAAASASAAPPLPALPVVNSTGSWFKPACGSTFLYSINEASVPVSNVKSKSGFSIDADVYGVDLFNTAASTIKGYHDAGKKVVCYFSAGSYEDGRADGPSIDSACYCNKGSSCLMDGWPEWWFDIHSPSCVSNLHTVMQGRIALAKEKGCDAVDPDNVDSYANSPGWATTEADQLAYLLFLSKAAHDAGLGITLKNAGDLLSDHTEEIVNAFDMSVIEQCEKYQECDKYKPFVDAGKAAFQIEYETGIKCTRPGFALSAYSQNALSYELITDMCSMPCGVASRSITPAAQSAPTGAALRLGTAPALLSIAALAALGVVAV